MTKTSSVTQNYQIPNNDRLVLYLTNSCGSFCRHCLRKRRFSQHDEHTPTSEIDKALAYINSDKDIRDDAVLEDLIHKGTSDDHTQYGNQ